MTSEEPVTVRRQDWSIRTKDGCTFIGPKAVRVVVRMKNDSWQVFDRKLPYMEEVVERVWAMTEVAPPSPITALTAQVFLGYLVATGMASWVVPSEPEKA